MVLDDTWRGMLEVRDLHDELRKDYITSLKKILISTKKSKYFKIIRDYFTCPDCGADIFEVDDWPETDKQGGKDIKRRHLLNRRSTIQVMATA